MHHTRGLTKVALAMGVAAAMAGTDPGGLVPETWSAPVQAKSESGGWKSGAERVELSWALLADGNLAVRVDVALKPGWHTYWQNAGAGGGAPPRIEWTLPEGWKAGAIQYPRPDVKLLEGEPFYGYEGKATFIATIARTGASSTPGQSPSERPQAEKWSCAVTLLICKDMCVMGTFGFEGSWPPAHPAEKVSLADLRFNGRQLPQGASEAKVTASWRSKEVLSIAGPAQGRSSVRFIPSDRPGLALGGPAAAKGLVTGTVKDGTFQIEVPLERSPVDSSGTLPDAEGLILLGERPEDPSVYVRASATAPSLAR